MLAGAAALLGRGSPASPPAAAAAAEEANAPVVEAGVDEAFELLEMLGKGSYGSVYKGRARASGELFAIKVIPLAEGVRLRAAQALSARRRDRRWRPAFACAAERLRGGLRSRVACALRCGAGAGPTPPVPAAARNPCAGVRCTDAAAPLAAAQEEGYDEIRHEIEMLQARSQRRRRRSPSAWAHAVRRACNRSARTRTSCGTSAPPSAANTCGL